MSGECRGGTWLTPHGTLPCNSASEPWLPETAQKAVADPILWFEAIGLLYSLLQLCHQHTEDNIIEEYNVHL